MRPHPFGKTHYGGLREDEVAAGKSFLPSIREFEVIHGLSSHSPDSRHCGSSVCSILGPPRPMCPRGTDTLAASQIVLILTTFGIASRKFGVIELLRCCFGLFGTIRLDGLARYLGYPAQHGCCGSMLPIDYRAPASAPRHRPGLRAEAPCGVANVRRWCMRAAADITE